MRIVISSGHALKVRGASGILDEVDEARKIVEAVAKNLRGFGHDVVTFHDDVSTSQNENLNRICNFHNAQDRALDCSVHLNAYIPTDAGMGTEVLYLTQEDIARRVVDAISNASGLINRGPKKRTDLYFLNNTDEPAILIETCFVDSKTDADLYRKYFDQICMAIARVGNQGRPQQYDWKGLVSWFGGPEDTGVSASEGLAFIYEYDDAPHLFLDKQPPNTSGLARRLDPDGDYIAMRWDYELTPREMLLGKLALVHAPKTGRKFYAHPADWGPHIDTNRIADISPGLMEKLGIITDDMIEISFPHDPKARKA